MMRKGLKIMGWGIATTMLLACNNPQNNVVETPSLKDAFKDRFTVGAALNLDQIHGQDTAALHVLATHFNSIVAENCMKSMYIQPKEGEFFFDDADQFVALGQKQGTEIIGHALVWHSQAPEWFFVDDVGSDVSRDVLIERMKAHIQTIVSRYKGKVHGWDVLNEAVMDDGTLRESKFLQIIGEDYIELAFRFAHEADPDAELYYNDYAMSMPGKRKTVVALVQKLQQKGLRIDAIGMQGHVGMDYPVLAEFEKSIETFAQAGVKVMITEFDLTVLPFPKRNIGAEVSEKFLYQEALDPYPDGLTDSVGQAMDERFLAFFQIFNKHSDKISRVTTWGIGDANSWRNDWPIAGRTDYPLLFDRAYQPKPVVEKIIALTKQ